MDKKQELLYLQQLVLDASTWRLSEGDDRDCIRLEVQDRLRRLAGQETIDQNGFAQSDKVEQKSNDKDYEYKAKWASARVRVKMPDGTYQWHLKTACEKIPVPGQNGKWKWGLKADSSVEPQ